MNRFALLTLLRSLTRHKLYAALNIGGLAVGIAVFLVLGLYVRFETGFEAWLPHHDQIYLIEALTSGMDRPAQNTPAILWEKVSRELPNMIGTRMYGVDASVLSGSVGIKQTMKLVDPRFFDVFGLPVIAGDPRTALADPSELILTAATATKYFGKSEPIGRTMTIVYNGEQHRYRVAAVLADLPQDTELSFDMLAPLVVPSEPDLPATTPGYATTFYHWNDFAPSTYVRLPDAAAARRFAAQLPDVVARNAGADFSGGPIDLKLSLQPIARVHFEAPGMHTTVTTLGVVGVLTLLIAIVNYINLATARAALRAREVAMRKVLGAPRAALVRQFIGEAIATAVAGAVIGLVLAEIGVPLVNAAGGLHMTIRYLGMDGVLPPLALLTLIVGVVAGVYPALVLSRYAPAAVLASAKTPGGGRTGARVREVLVVFQFALAIAFMIATGVLVAQTRHVRATDLGFRRDGLLIVKSFASASLDQTQRATILARLRSTPGVSAVAVGDDAPGGTGSRSTNSVEVPGVEGNGPDLWTIRVSPDFFTTLGIPVTAGRGFDRAHPGDAVDDAQPNTVRRSIVINQAALAPLHFRSAAAAIGKTIGGESPVTVIGVVADTRFASPRDPIHAAYYLMKDRDLDGVALVRFTGDPNGVKDAVAAAWRISAPQVPFQAQTTEQSLDRYYSADDHAARIFGIGAGLAVLIGCVGLWGLASFNTARRTREIGIRKVLGASSSTIVRLLVGQFLRPVATANLIAWPLAFVAMRSWLAGFDDRIALSPLFFLGATLLALGIAVATVLAQSLRAARATPAWALRHD